MMAMKTREIEGLIIPYSAAMSAASQGKKIAITASERDFP